MPNIQRIALHEAAHAVIGCSFGLHFSTVTIEPTAADVGHCQFDSTPDLERFNDCGYRLFIRTSDAARVVARAVVEPQIVASLAGFAVDARFLRKTCGEHGVTLARRTFRLPVSSSEWASLQARLDSGALSRETLADQVAALMTDARHDIQSALEMAVVVTLTPLEAGLFVSQRWQQAEELVGRFWAVIETVAAELLNSRSLVEERVRAHLESGG